MVEARRGSPSGRCTPDQKDPPRQLTQHLGRPVTLNGWGNHLTCRVHRSQPLRRGSFSCGNASGPGIGGIERWRQYGKTPLSRTHAHRYACHSDNPRSTCGWGPTTEWCRHAGGNTPKSPYDGQNPWGVLTGVPSLRVTDLDTPRPRCSLIEQQYMQKGKNNCCFV